MLPRPMVEHFVMQPPNQSVERTGRKRPSAHFQRWASQVQRKDER